MTDKRNLFNIGLPKWTNLIVSGKDVTIEQAQEIIIRTSDLNFISNNRDFVEKLNEIVYNVKSSFGIDYDKIMERLSTDRFYHAYNYVDKRRREVGLLKLNHLRNVQICSCYIAGTHGWCSWDGVIKTSNYCIGKWPTVSEVYNDWKKIAKAFPFLDLKCQLVNYEKETILPDLNINIPGINELLVEFIVKDGKVTIQEPTEPLLDIIDPLNSLISSKGVDFDMINDVGCTIEQFKAAYEYTKERVANRKRKKIVG